MTKDFIKAVADQELAKVRMMLSNELLLDPRGQSFTEMLQYAKDRVPRLFEVEKPSRFTIPTDKSEWTEETLSKMKRDLNMNFSVEKLALFEEMAKHLGASKASDLDTEAKTRQKEDNLRNQIGSTTNTRSSEQKVRASRKTTGTIVTGSGAIIAITGFCVEGAVGTLLSIIGGAVVVCGVALLTVPNKK